MNNQNQGNQSLIPNDMQNAITALNGLNQLNNMVTGLTQPQQPNYNYKANINDPNNPYNVDAAQQGMAQSNLPGNLGQNFQNAYVYLDKNGWLETRVEKLGIRVPTYFDNCYKRIFRRNVPTQCQTCGYTGTWDTHSNCGIGLIGCSVLTCLTCPQGIICPLVIDDCYDHTHNCPNCKQEVGKERFILG